MAKILVYIKKAINKINKLFLKSIAWYCLAFLSFICGLMFFYISYLDGNPFEPDLFIFVIIYLFLAILALCNGIILKRREERKTKYGYREYLLQELRKEEISFTPDDNIFIGDKNVEDVVDDNATDVKRMGKKDIIAQMLDNNDEIKEYFKISKSQAKSSYWFSVISCVLGIIMLGLAIYGAIVIGNVQVAIIGTISGAIIEVISGTVLWVHNKSALQLNHYYDALHQNEKFLSAINMADKLSDEKREEMYIEIIRKQTDISSLNNKKLNQDTST